MFAGSIEFNDCCNSGQPCYSVPYFQTAYHRQLYYEGYEWAKDFVEWSPIPCPKCAGLEK